VCAQKGYQLELSGTMYTYVTQIVTRSYEHVWRASGKYTTFVITWEGHVLRIICFGSMEEDGECDYDHILIDDSSTQGGDMLNYSIGEDNLNMCKDDVIETNLM
jgi:hypothetical protein